MRSVRESTQEIVKLGIAPMFKRHGFRKTGFNFSRRRGTVEHHFNVQLSQWNQGPEGHFYLNAGVLFDDLRRLSGKDSLVATRCHDCEFCVRLEQIDPLLPRQFDLDENTDLNSLAAWLAERVETSFVVPLNAVSSTQEFLVTGWVDKIPLGFPAVFQYVIGNRAKARCLVELQAQAFADRGCTFKSIADRLHLEFSEE